MKRTLLGLLALAGLFIAALPACGPQPAAESTTAPDTRPVGPQVGKVAPEFSLPSLSGYSVSLASLRGQPVMLNFWATW